MERIKDLGSPIGIGLWKPDGQGGISSVIVYTDADPERHQVRGLSTYRADWTLDEAAETASLAWTASLQSIDGTSLPNASGRSSLARLHRLELAAGGDLRPSGRAGLGADRWVPWPMGAGSGSVAVLSPAENDCEFLDLPGSMVVHGDGTSFFTSPKGSGVGLVDPERP